ncbi:MAG: hypothetical protein RIR45_487 [Pseudomonadota bacterium]|jgi:putrescine transport system substrate-binding protein
MKSPPSEKPPHIPHPADTMLIAVVFVVAFSLAACQRQSQPTEVAQAAKPVQTAPQVEARELHIANWPDYIQEGAVEAFEKETGVRVVYDTFKNNEELQKILESQPQKYDLVFPGAGWGHAQKESGHFQPLDKTLLTNLSNLDPRMMARLSTVDPGNRYFVPWGSGYTTVTVNKTMLRAALGSGELPANAWDLVFDPTWAKRVSSCGLAYLDSPSEILPLMLLVKGLSPYSENLADYASARAELDRVRPFIKLFTTKTVNALVSRKVCVAIAFSGDIVIAQNEMAAAGIKDELVALFPTSGSLGFVDVAAIPAQARHPKNAHLFLDYMLRVENARQFIEEVGYPNGNEKAVALLPDSVKGDPIVFPSAAFQSRLAPPQRFTNPARWEMLSQYLKFAYNIGE